jgi:HK97 family phage portal protein
MAGLLARVKGWAQRISSPPASLAPYYMLAGGFYAPALSGEPVTPQRAMSQASVYGCLALISGALAAPEWEVIRQDQGRQPVRNVPAARALDTLDFSEREALVWDCWASGNAFARIWRGANGHAGELERLTASQMTILADVNGVAAYRYLSPYDGKTVELAAKDVLHIRCRTLGLWPIVGVPPILSSVDTVGLALALDRYKSTALANGSGITGTLNTDGKIDRQKAAHLKKRWTENFSGGINAGRVAVLEQGLKFNPISCQSLVDLQMAEASRIAAGEIAKLFLVPPLALGDTGSVNRASAQVEFEALYRNCLFPAAIRVSDQIGRQLLGPDSWSAGLRVEIDLEGWLRGSGASLADMLSKLVLGGIATPDEARGFIGLPPAANGGGAVLLRPVNMATADQQAAALPEPAEPISGLGARPQAILARDGNGAELVLDLAEFREALAAAAQASLAPAPPIASGTRMEQR